jgi:hypothetical protein
VDPVRSTAAASPRGRYERHDDGDSDSFVLGKGARGFATVEVFDPAGELDASFDVRGTPAADAEPVGEGWMRAALSWRW